MICRGDANIQFVNGKKGSGQFKSQKALQSLLSWYNIRSPLGMLLTMMMLMVMMVAVMMVVAMMM